MTAKTEETFDSIAAAFVQQGLAQGFLRVHFTGASTPPEFEITDAVAYETAQRQNGVLQEDNQELTVVCDALEAAREAVRHDLQKLQKSFDVLEARLAPASTLKASLRLLEDEAAHYGYEMLSRVGAILHDTLRYNPIEDFDEEQLQGFVLACKQATEGQADQSDPYACELAMFRVGLSWLPVIPDVFLTDEEDNTMEA